MSQYQCNRFTLKRYREVTSTCINPQTTTRIYYLDFAVVLCVNVHYQTGKAIYVIQDSGYSVSKQPIFNVFFTIHGKNIFYFNPIQDYTSITLYYMEYNL